MEIDNIIFDEEKYLTFTDNFFIHDKSENWKVSVIFDGTTWENVNEP
jgi:hypothetical protein